jgi:hypothetical protein
MSPRHRCFSNTQTPILISGYAHIAKFQAVTLHDALHQTCAYFARPVRVIHLMYESPESRNHTGRQNMFYRIWEMPHPSHPLWFGDPNNIRWKEKLWCSLLCSFLHLPIISSLADSNVLKSQSSIALTLFSFHKVREVSQPCKTTGKLVDGYISNFTSLNGNWEGKRFWMAANILQSWTVCT